MPGVLGARRDVDGVHRPGDRHRLRAPVRRAPPAWHDTAVAHRRCCGAKTLGVLCVELLQVALLCLVGALLGWSPARQRRTRSSGCWCWAPLAFSALGLLMAGTLARGGDARRREPGLPRPAGPRRRRVPAHRLLRRRAASARAASTRRLSDGLRAVLDDGDGVPLHDWVTLRSGPSRDCAAVALVPLGLAHLFEEAEQVVGVLLLDREDVLDQPPGRRVARRRAS